MSPTVRSALAAALAVLALFCWSSSAAAQARHERVAVTPIKRKGKTAGALLKVTLRPEGVHASGQLILGRHSPGTYTFGTYRDAATHPDYVLRVLEVFSELTGPVDRTFKLMFDAVFTPGMKLDLTSVWTGKAGVGVHVWGMARAGVTDAPIVLPD